MDAKAPSRFTVFIFSLVLCLALGLAFTSAGRADDPSPQAQHLTYLPLVVRQVLYHESTGVLDESFGQGGMVITDFPGGADDYAKALALQSDGKILAAGYAYNGSDNDFAVARYNPDGSLDPSFSGDGWAVTDFSGADDQARAMLLQPDGKIILVGYTDDGTDFNLALARYTPDGNLDASFAGGGKLASDLAGEHDSGYAAALQPDGKIIVAGFTFMGSDNDLLVARYHVNGSLDTSFAGTGWTALDFGSSFDTGYALGLQADGKILAAGVASPEIEDSDFALARFYPDGSLDVTFDADGWLLTDFGGYYDRAKALAVQPDGKLLLAGDSNGDFALARYTPNGSLDPEFGTGGLLLNDFFTRTDIGNALALQAEGKLVVAGATLVCKDTDYSLARFMPTGNLDRTFEGDGMLISFIYEIKEYAYAVLQQPDGKLLVAGVIDNGSGFDFMLVRLK